MQIQLPDLPDGCAWVDSIGHALIKKVTLEVGGQPIDEQSGAWLEICSELMLTGAQRGQAQSGVAIYRRCCLNLFGRKNQR